MNEFQYLQVKEMIEQNAQRKKFPLMLISTVEAILGSFFLFKSLVFYLKTGNWAVPFYLSVGMMFIIAIIISLYWIGNINKRRGDEIAELIDVKNWSEEYKKESTFLHCKLLKEYFSKE